ncbi:DUF6494 family protein [Arhodomonas sp. SL1]|uniref:DUF6494 family protein n=1 Tax=Arhodomonas sp. SL1 TaxID=3425691 RepID=UPI003F8829F9
MDEDALNMSIRRFLKKVGITSQREIETAARALAEEGRLPQGSVAVTVTLRCEELGVEHHVDGELELRD